MQGKKREIIAVIEQIGLKQSDGSFLFIDSEPKIRFAEVEAVSGTKALKYGFSDISQFFRVVVNVAIPNTSKLVVRGKSCVINDNRRLSGVVEQYEVIATLSEIT